MYQKLPYDGRIKYNFIEKYHMKTMITILTIVFYSAITMSCDKHPNTQGDTIQNQIAAFPKETLSGKEFNGLLKMREEEKLAYDVYTALNFKWNVMIFNNIKSSEQRHTEAVLSLLSKYNIEDSAANIGAGVFTDTSLQRIYNQLLSIGNISHLDAMTVGATIEDLDIYDLQKLLLDSDNQDLTFVYNNLLKGSRNHMRAFYGQIISNGGTYRAQYITQQELEEIVNSPKETGAWRKQK